MPKQSESLPVGWAACSIGDIIPKPRVKVKPNKDSKLPFIGMDHIEAESFHLTGQDEFRNMKSAGSPFSPDDVLYGRLRPYLNKVHCAKFEGVASAEFIVLPSSDTHDSNFIKYLLHHIRFVQYANEKSSGDRPRIKFDRLAEYDFSLPPHAEQERIVDKIDELFSAIEAGERAIDQARIGVARYRKAILKAAVTGELTKDWRDENPIKESAEDLLARIITARYDAWEKAELAKLDAKGKARPETEKQWEKFRGRYKPPVEPNTDELPKLPSEWIWVSPVQVEEIKQHALAIGPFGSNLKVSDYEDEGVPLVFVRHIRSGKFSADKPKFVSNEKADELKAHSVSGGDLLITKMGDPPGEARVYPKTAPWAIITADCIKWTVSSKLAGAKYFEVCVNSVLVSQQIKKITRGVAQQKVSLAMFRQLGFPLPPIEEQAEIVDRVEQALSRADAVEATLDAQSRAAKALKQAVLKTAFEGKLVPQNPNDEPASELLKRIKAAS